MRAFYFNTIPGATAFSDPGISSTTILGVKREGIGYNEVSSSPGPRDFVYAVSGLLTFSVAFNPGEKLFVLCL